MVEIYDKAGGQQDLRWLAAKHGNVRVFDGQSARFRLARVDETEGPAVLTVRVLDAAGLPMVGQPVANAWLGLTEADGGTLLDGRGVKRAYRPVACVQRTDQNGVTGFGLGTGSYTRDLAEGGPHTAWVLSPSVDSDGIAGIGMLPGTNHLGPLSLTFQLIDEGDGVDEGDEGNAADVLRAEVVPAIRDVGAQLHADLAALLAAWLEDEGREEPAPATGSPELALLRPVRIGDVTQWFGENPQNYAGYGLAGHEGIDYGVPVGTQVYAAHAGKVTGCHKEGAYGLHVVLERGDTSTVYAHLSMATVTAGQEVTAGALIGRSGNSGRSMGAHLHFGWKVKGVRNPAYQDWLDPALGRLLEKG